MNLPKTKYPLVSITLPSTGTKHMFRPMLVSEEKILLTAKQGEEPGNILLAIKQAVNNCSQDPTFTINKATLTDVEFVFLKLRSASVGNIVPVTYRDLEDGKEYKFDIDLEKVTVTTQPPEISKTIKVDEDVGMVMKPPPATIYDDPTFDLDDDESLYKMACLCIENIFDKDNVYEPQNHSSEELNKWLDGLSLKAMGQLKDFLATVPRLNYEIKYKNSLGSEKTIVLSALSDFFMLY